MKSASLWTDEEAVKEIVMKELHLLEIFDSINEGIYILDKNGNYIYCNSAFLKMVGATKEEVESQNAFRLVQDGQVSVSVADLAFKKKKKVAIINNVTTPKGYHYRQMATASPIFDAMGEVEYLLVEMVRLDLFQRRYQNAILSEDKNGIDFSAYEEHDGKESVFIAESSEMKTVKNMAELIAKVDATILITGETGTGKEVLADFIHKNSNRADKPMVEINCAAIPENLLEAELFGYEKGAFTGALNTGKAGLIEKADAGILFLDEINSLPLAIQGKLLRVLETHKVKRLGAVTERVIDFRLLAATNQSLKKCIDAGTFREDLYYRINVVPIEIPPLRKRREDIVPLILYFLDHFCEKYGRTKMLSKELLQKMSQYEWPGNVRELKNAVERLVLTWSVGSTEIKQIPEEMYNNSTMIHEDLDHPRDIQNKLSEIPIDFSAEDFSLKSYMEKCEKSLLQETLKHYNSSYKAAAALKTDQSTIVRKRKKYNI